MKLHFPNDTRLTLSGTIRQRESGLVLELPDTDYVTHTPTAHDFPLIGYDAETQSQIQGHVEQEVTLWGIWHSAGAANDLVGDGFLQVTAIRPHEE